MGIRETLRWIWKREGGGIDIDDIDAGYKPGRRKPIRKIGALLLKFFESNLFWSAFVGGILGAICTKAIDKLF